MYFVSGPGIVYQESSENQGPGFYVPSRIGDLLILPTGRLATEPRFQVEARVKTPKNQPDEFQRTLIRQANENKATSIAAAERTLWQDQKNGGVVRWPNATRARISVTEDTPALRSHRFETAPLRKPILPGIGKLAHRAVSREKNEPSSTLLYVCSWQDEFYPMTTAYQIMLEPVLSTASVLNSLNYHDRLPAHRPDPDMPNTNEYFLLAVVILFRAHDSLVVCRHEGREKRLTTLTWDGDTLSTMTSIKSTKLWHRDWLD
ncbi:MAG: hypothetical protein Q7R83_01485 [bacterium]|nr:hypothetical protein [bacterium]